MKTLFLILTILIFGNKLNAQEMWVQTGAVPQGGGVTDMVVTDQGTILVTTASFNWPNGQPGGIRRSTDQGNTWQNVLNGFNARTITIGYNSAIYASFWDYPSPEGLYRSTNDGVNWSLLYSLPAGNNNIFAIEPKENNNPMFIGTRNGVQRSLNGGSNFISVNNGIPANSWVRDLATGPQGIIAAATTNGAFVSTNNGDSWQQVSGITPGDTIVRVSFMQNTTDELTEDVMLLGTQNGKFYENNDQNGFLHALTLYIFNDDPEISSVYILFVKDFVAGKFSRGSEGGGVSRTTDGGMTFMDENNGFPENPPISALTGYQLQRNAASVEIYAGLFENTTNGARIFRRVFPIGIQQISSIIPQEFFLSQNYPNPFNPVTQIKFSIPAWKGSGTDRLVKISVYDMLGREAAIIVNEQLTAGIYEVDWDATVLPSGVYFYKLQAGDYSETKKMMLVK